MSIKSPFKYYKTSPEVIRFAVKLRVHYRLSLCQCEDMLAERGFGSKWRGWSVCR